MFGFFCKTSGITYIYLCNIGNIEGFSLENTTPSSKTDKINYINLFKLLKGTINKCNQQAEK